MTGMGQYAQNLSCCSVFVDPEMGAAGGANGVCIASNPQLISGMHDQTHDTLTHDTAFSLAWQLAMLWHASNRCTCRPTRQHVRRYKCVVASMDGEAAADQEAASSVSELSAESALREAGPETCACWLGPSGSHFATGHEQGDVLIWQLPGSILGETDRRPHGLVPWDCSPLQLAV